MNNRSNIKITKKYHFSVEGENEKWYLQHLQLMINSINSNPYNVKFDIKIQKSVLKRAKALSVIYPTTVFHVCDFESKESLHTLQFANLLDELKVVKELRNDIQYKLGYSNFTFELWIILHKIECNNMLQHRKNYLLHLNNAYKTNFKFLDDYKREKNFKDILKELNIQHVINAINRANKIKQHHIDKDDNLIEYQGFKYYKDNPDLTIHECIEKILSDCKIITSTKGKQP